MPTYEQFYQDVKEQVKNRLACFDLSDQELDDYLKKEESQIAGAYWDLTNPGDEAEGMTPEANYKASVSTVAMCLEYCY